jgi:hypothetical protein
LRRDIPPETLLSSYGSHLLIGLRLVDWTYFWMSYRGP